MTRRILSPDEYAVWRTVYARRYWRKNNKLRRTQKREWVKAHLEQNTASQKAWRVAHAEDMREYNRNYIRKWRDKNPAKEILYRRVGYAKNHKKRSAAANNWNKTHRDQVNRNKRKYGIRNRMQKNNAYLSGIVKTSIRDAVRHNKKSASSVQLIGCSIVELRDHLESKWLPGMSWDNYGKYGWHIDHRIPCAAFDLSKSEHQRACFHYTNLQPLWAKDNLEKGRQVPADAVELLNNL